MTPQSQGHWRCGNCLLLTGCYLMSQPSRFVGATLLLLRALRGDCLQELQEIDVAGVVLSHPVGVEGLLVLFGHLVSLVVQKEMEVCRELIWEPEYHWCFEHHLALEGAEEVLETTWCRLTEGGRISQYDGLATLPLAVTLL